MPVTVNANGLSVVHRGSTGMASATLPDVCKTPSASGTPVPVPYPNIAMSSDLVAGTTTVTVDGQMAAIQGSKFVKSTGDEAGVAGGVISSVFIMEATFISFSPTVSMDGMPVCRLTDKMLMNRGNTACLGGELQAPVPLGTCNVPVKSNAEDPVFCVFEKLVLRCGHESRKYKLNAFELPGTTIQVLANKVPEKMYISFSGMCGVEHTSPGCAKPHVIDEEGKEVAVSADYMVELPLPNSPTRFAGDWWRLIRNLLQPGSMKSDMYTVYGTTCNGTGTDAVPAGEYALIEVFPNAGWSGEVEFGYKYDKVKVSKDKTAFTELQGQGSFSIKGKITASIGRTDLSFEASAEGDAAKKDSDVLSRQLFKHTQDWLSRLGKIFASLENFYDTKLDIRWPALKIGGGISLTEVEGKRLVVPEGSFYFDASPLLGLQFSLDILEWLISWGSKLAGPGGMAFGEFLLAAKKKAAKGIEVAKGGATVASGSATISIVLTVGGDISGGLGWKVQQGKVTVDGGKARIEAGVDWKLEAVAKIEATVFIVRAAAGASLSALSADGSGPARISGKLQPSDGPGFGVKGLIEFTGMAIYYAYFSELGKKAEEASDDPPPSVKKGVAPAYGSKESRVLCTLFDAHQWPKPEEPTIQGVLR
ncbi:MAG: hypothetical protein RL701_91 [Pseudomonadota bacterium]